MPNVRRQILGPLDSLGPTFVGQVGIHITASNGKTITLLKDQILSQYSQATGNAAQRKATTLAWVASQIETALGVDQVPASSILHDFNPADGNPLRLEIS